jgi:hypothetical protein
MPRKPTTGSSYGGGGGYPFEQTDGQKNMIPQKPIFPSKMREVGLQKC